MHSRQNTKWCTLDNALKNALDDVLGDVLGDAHTWWYKRSPHWGRAALLGWKDVKIRNMWPDILNWWYSYHIACCRHKPAIFTPPHPPHSKPSAYFNKKCRRDDQSPKRCLTPRQSVCEQKRAGGKKCRKRCRLKGWIDNLPVRGWRG